MTHLQRHHKYWPRKAYKTRIEKAFRQLPCNIERVTAEDHRAIHAKYPNGNPGGKPTNAEMYQAIHKHLEGRCTCPPTEVQLQLF